MSDTLKEIEIDALGEILNISMGSAATAVSTMLDTKVEITTPHVEVKSLKEISTNTYEPAMIVKIVYVDGIPGSNVMVFRQRDMKEILSKLMGMEVSEDDDFDFDEIAMSAACEVMNQMMGSSATALSEFLGRTIDISPPDAYLMDDEHTFKDAIGIPVDQKVVATNFKLVIGDNIDSQYMSITSVELAKALVNPFVGGGLLDENPIESSEKQKEQRGGAVTDSSESVSQEQPSMSSESTQGQSQQPQVPMQPQQAQVAMQSQVPMQPQTLMPSQQAGQMPPQQAGQMPPQGYGYPPQGYGYPPQGYPYGYMPGYPYPPQMDSQGKSMQSNVQHVGNEPVNVQNVNLPRFNMNQPVFNAPVNGNVDLIMNVPLGVSVELGRTKRKVKDILDFTQGTVIELEKQAGASADIIVNGQLIARGDVVVMDDNFGVRITEIINVKDLIASEEQAEKE